MSAEDVIRECHEADRVYRRRLAEELAKDELVTLPADVREARAATACAAEAERLAEARAAHEVMVYGLKERQVRAEEFLGALRESSPS